MTVKTSSGSTYHFIVMENTIRTDYHGREIIVTEIRDLQIGKRMCVKGFALNPITYARTSEDFSFITSPIIAIN